MAFITALLILLGTALGPALGGHGVDVHGHLHTMDGGGMPVGSADSGLNPGQ